MGAIVHRAIVLGEGLLFRGLLYRGYCPRTGNKRGLWHFDGFDSASEGHSSICRRLIKAKISGIKCQTYSKMPRGLTNTHKSVIFYLKQVKYET